MRRIQGPRSSCRDGGGRVGVEYVSLAVSNVYRYKSSGKPATSRDYANTRKQAEAIYGHSRLHLPYGLILIGY